MLAMRLIHYGDGIHNPEPVISYIPIVFPNMLVHKQMAEDVVLRIKCGTPSATVTVRSAGTISLTDLTCSGYSESLGLGPHEDDALIIRTHDYLHGLISSKEELHDVASLLEPRTGAP